ncbi:hypothetical protein DFJ67_4152 [Asanoa ferruginea]|uniref:Uncharacterized protein n=1 Tax=Asanoa ferruginea TaxID=53367 RepID=A0A3D9ZNR8_9ACTN|nr:hypothetical protein [Asanoa ferruginea]REF98142.1 hypothetical protein DFJ67_4152 [Asanoa ferruginea]GIF50891.1 hypothetical protein Afe04nite_54300 [Asanoa ferruginea]
MKPGGGAALAVGVGYVLGRQHKLRTALMVGAAAAGGRMAARNAGGGGGNGKGQDNQGNHHGSGLVSKLGGAGKTAAVSAFVRSADRIGERLTERAMAMRQGDSDSDSDSGEEDK